MVDHARLADGWSLWRCSVLRGAGFPASLVLRLTSSESAAAARRVLAAEAEQAAARKRVVTTVRAIAATAPREVAVRLGKVTQAVWKWKVPADTGTAVDPELAAMRAAMAKTAAESAAFAATFEASRAAVSGALRAIAATPRLREAVAWQNQAALESAFDPLMRSTGDTSKDRLHEDLVASYLHRYCTKNDTIGFFGPVGWARWDDAPAAIVAQPGASLVAKRSVYFEQWPIDALARTLSNDPRARPWIAPRRYGFVRLEGTTAHSPVSGKHELSSTEAETLVACDGTRPARELDAAALEALCAKQLVAWTLEFRTRWAPDEELERRIATLGDVGARTDGMAKLAELRSKRDRVAAAAGDPERLTRAMTELNDTFTRLTGERQQQHAGGTYAGRTVVFEDTTRDFDLAFGKPVLDALGPSLALVLGSARCLTYEYARAIESACGDLHREMAAKLGRPAVPFTDFWLRSQRLVHGAKNRPLDAVARSIAERWSSLLGIDASSRRVDTTSAAIAPRVEKAFDAPRAGWTMATYHAPDILIGASSVDAIARGEWFAVLGEIHVALNTVDDCVFASQHPSPDELRGAVESDIDRPRVLLVPPKHSPLSSVVRESRYVVTARDFDIETGLEGSLLPKDRVLAVGDLEVEPDGDTLVVRSRDGKISFPLVEVMGQTLSESVANALTFVDETSDHSPRVAIDRLVVHRESWRVVASDLAFADAKTPAQGFLGAMRWAAARGLPRFVFVKSPLEVKPIFLDFENPISVRIFRKLVRRAQEHPGAQVVLKVSEMLPDLEQIWLADAGGDRYTSEIRMVAVDPRR